MFEMRCFATFFTALCVVFLMKLLWPMNENLYDLCFVEHNFFPSALL